MPNLHVTEVIRLNELSDDDQFQRYVTTEQQEFFLRRGQYVHEAIKLWCDGKLDEDTLDPMHVRPRVESFIRFIEQSGAVVVASELKVVHDPMGYEGTLDNVLRFPRLGLYVTDSKNGGPEDWHQYQLAGYAMAYQLATGGPTLPRAGLYLSPDGKAAKFVRHPDYRDFARWKSLVSVAHQKKARGAVA